MHSIIPLFDGDFTESIPPNLLPLPNPASKVLCVAVPDSTGAMGWVIAVFVHLDKLEGLQHWLVFATAERLRASASQGLENQVVAPAMGEAIDRAVEAHCCVL
jgi:hypothetical protein